MPLSSRSFSRENDELLNELPYQNCTDNEIIQSYSNSKNEFLQSLENNNLTKQIIQQSLNHLESFNCSYQNENSFQKLNKDHNSKSLKVP